MSSGTLLETYPCFYTIAFIMGAEHKLKFTVLCEVEDILDTSALGSTNFNISTTDEYVLSITCKVSPDYFFRVKRGHYFECDIQPGEIHFSDKPNFNSIKDAFPRVKSWAADVSEEIRLKQERLEKDRLILTWESGVAAKYPSPDQPLIHEDFETWKKIVEDLQARVAELEKKGTISEEQVKAIVSEGEEVAKQSASMPGAAWMRRAGKYLVSVLKYVSQDPDVRKHIVSQIESATKELPAHVETVRQAIENIGSNL